MPRHWHVGCVRARPQHPLWYSGREVSLTCQITGSFFGGLIDWLCVCVYVCICMCVYVWRVVDWLGLQTFQWSSPQTQPCFLPEQVRCPWIVWREKPWAQAKHSSVRWIGQLHISMVACASRWCHAHQGGVMHKLSVFVYFVCLCLCVCLRVFVCVCLFTCVCVHARWTHALGSLGGNAVLTCTSVG